MNVTLLATCSNCAGTLALKHAAIEQGYEVIVEVVKHSDERTQKSAEAGIGLPVLVRDDGAMSDDAKEWRDDEPKKRTRVTHPMGEVVEDALHDQT